MSVIEFSPIETESFDFADDKVIHLWKENAHAVCGSTLVNHNCRQEKGDFVWADFHAETNCPSCSKPLCPFCALLCTG